MPAPLRALRPVAAFACVALAAAGCGVSPVNDAPIVDHSLPVGANAAAPVAAAQPARTAPPAVREAHDGLYVVQQGDTLYSIALAFGQDFRDIARWNGLDDPGQIHAGQSLRVAPAAAEESSASAVEATPVPVAPSGAPEARPLAPAVAAAPAPAAAAPEAGEAAPAAAPAQAPPPEPVVAALSPSPEKGATAEADSVWAWPSAGKLLERFDETRNKGIDIDGSVGDPVWAANDGQVVYSGSGLRGYGKLVIIKHTDDYVSAYAHNNEILVTQGQAVKRGQRIADLGMTDAATPRLHFEIRRRGTPVDPLMYLPSR